MKVTEEVFNSAKRMIEFAGQNMSVKQVSVGLGLSNATVCRIKKSATYADYKGYMTHAVESTIEPADIDNESKVIALLVRIELHLEKIARSKTV